MNLDKITAGFDRAYSRNDKAKKWLVKKQQQLFDALTEDLAKQPLSQKTVVVLEPDPDQYIKTYYPGWRIVDLLPTVAQGEIEHVAILEEDPALLKHHFTNKETGRVFGRTIVEGSPSLDDERLKSENPELWEKITEWPEPWYSLVKDLYVRFVTLTWKADVLESNVGEHLAENGIQRVLRDFNKLSNDDLVAIEPYLIPGPRSVRLVPPRDAKPEELEDA